MLLFETLPAIPGADAAKSHPGSSGTKAPAKARAGRVTA
jgi:hypothetical protein